MNQPVSRHVEVEKQNICYQLRKGINNQTLFCIHGLGGCKSAFCDIWNADGYEDYTILVIDLPGFGDSSKDEAFSFSMQDQAIICLELLNKLDIQDCHLILHSMAGPIGLLFAEQLGTSLKTFAYLEGNLLPSDFGLLSRTTQSVSFEEFEDRLLPKFKSFIRNSPAEIEGIQKSWPLAFYRSAVSLVEITDSGILTVKLENIKSPKAYFYGEKNSEMEVFSHIKFIQTICIPNAGHSMMNDNPKDFYTVLRSFIENNVYVQP